MEISELMDLRIDTTRTCQDVERRAEIKITDIEQKVETLQRIKGALMKLAAICTGGSASTTECPILEAIGNAPGKFENK